MSDSVRERVLKAIAARLQAISSVPGLAVYRNLHDPVEKFPALVLHDGDEDAGEQQTVFVERVATPIVQGFCKTKDRDLLGTLVNQLYAETVKALTADPSLGGISVDVRQGGTTLNMDPEGDADRQGSFLAIFQVDYTHKHGDPYTLAP